MPWRICKSTGRCQTVIHCHCPRACLPKNSLFHICEFGGLKRIMAVKGLNINFDWLLGNQGDVDLVL